MSEELNNTIDKFFEDVYAMRKDSLEKDGEYGIGNLVFKELRSRGYLDNLKDIKCASVSKDLSLEGLKESVNTSDIINVFNSIDDSNLEDGSYKLVNGKLEKQNLTSGYQVSFFRPKITQKEIKSVLDVIGNKLGDIYIGVYGGSKELSYAVNDLDKALKIAEIFNQESIWNNAKGIDGYIDNKHYNELIEVNYKDAIKALKGVL